MADNIPQSVAYTVVFKAYLSDGVTAATGKTIAITISKNTAAFGNPSAGATNATEIASGWYYVALSTTDTGTLGPVIVHGAVAGVDNVDLAFYVVNANTGGWAALPNAAAEAAGGLYTRGVGAGQINQPANGMVDTNPVRILGTAISTPATAGIMDVNVKNINNVAAATPGAAGGVFIAGTNAATTVTTALTTTFTGNLTGSVASVSGAVASVTGLTASDVGAIKTKTDFMPSVTAGAAGGLFIAGANAATSITTALTANITGNVSGSVNSVATGVTVTTNNDKTGYTASTVSDKTGYALTVGERTSIADAMLDEVAGVETGLTVRQWLRLAAAALFGKLSGVSTSAPKFRDTGDTKNRISASTSSDGRSSVTLDSS